MATRSRALVVVLAAATLAGCGSGGNGRIEGSGAAMTETRSVGAFTRVELAGGATVHVHPGSPQAVTVSGDDNIVPLVTTRVENGTLVVDQEKNRNFATHEPLVVDVRAPGLTASVLSGAGSMTVDGVSGPTFTAEVSGLGSLDVAGAVLGLHADVSGSGSALLDHLVSKDATVVLSGMGSAHVFATHSLNASVDGMGSVVYGGNPQHVQKQVTGAGAVAAE
ncbi:MAG TPA: DUF2807 domain-containing protein [Gaiellaceae bacterium]